MKKILLALALACTCMVASAQHKVYCELMNFNPAGGSKAVISFDFGSDAVGELLDDKGKKIKFKSPVDALSYMERIGWSVVSSYSVVHVAGTTNVPVVHYLLQKEVKEYNEKMEGLNVKTKQTRESNPTDDGYGY